MGDIRKKVISMVEMEESGKILMAAVILVLLVTTFVAFGALFMVTFSGSLSTASADATTTTVFTGSPGVDAQLNAPIISIGYFGKAENIKVINTTGITGANGHIHFMIDSHAANGAANWEKINVTINSTGANSTTNYTWIAGDCRGSNVTGTGSPETWTSITASCLTPGAQITLNFVNTTTAGEAPANITNVQLSYFRYVANTAYSSNLPAGTVTPFLAGYYQTTYTYGAGGIDYTDAKTSLASGVTTISNIPNWLGIIILVFVLLVIFVLLAAIAYVAKGMGGGKQ
jgi:hypothetical protein